MAVLRWQMVAVRCDTQGRGGESAVSVAKS